VPIACRRSASAGSNAMGEWMNRSPLPSRTTVIRVVNGNGSLTPAVVKYSKGPSTIPMFRATGLY
jgi:hypothetical protein